MQSRTLCRAALAAMSLVIVLRSAPAAEIHEIRWSNDVDAAWQQAVTKNRPLLIYVTSPGCKYCTLMKKNTYSDPQVAKQIQQSFVAVAVDASRSRRLVRELKVEAYPTTLVVSPKMVLVDRLEGYAPPRQMHKRLAAALKRNAK